MTSPFTSRYDAIVQESLERWHAPGVAIAVVHGSDTWTKGYGLAQQDPPKPVEPTALFYAASTTKAQLCAAWEIYIRSESNLSRPASERITWSTPLANIIRDDFVLSDPIRTTQVTLEDAVSHRTGLPRHEASYGYEGVKTPKDLTRNLRNLYFHHELREKFEYCNTPFVAASHALETLTGKPLAHILRESLWQPLGMSHTYGGYGEASAALQADSSLVLVGGGSVWSELPTSANEAQGHLVEEESMDFPEVSGAGYVISTAEDYAKWMRAWLSSPSSSPLSKDMKKELWSPRSIVPTDGDMADEHFTGITTYALGWFVATYRGHAVYWHPGGLIGSGSYVLLCPDIGFGVAFFANVMGASTKFKGLAVELLDAALGLPEPERTERANCDDEAVRAYKKVVADAATARETLYPHSASAPSIPLSLPLAAYTGTFRHAGYGSLRVVAAKDEEGKECLEVDLSDRTWRYRLLLQHVNAESWIVTRTMGRSPYKTLGRAESKVGVDGTVSWGVGMEPAMPEVLTWFTKG